MVTKIQIWQIRIYNRVYFWPLLIMAGRIVQRVVLNLWNIVEPGGAY